MKVRISFLVAVISMFLIWNPRGYSLEENSHKAINEHVAQNTVNGFSLDSYLKNNLGLLKGVQELLYGYSEIKRKYDKQEVFIWLGEGGIQEDRPGSITDYITGKPTRSVNHFHNPLKTNWNDAGLNDSLYIPFPFYLGRGNCNVATIPLYAECWYTGQSSVLWAQNPNQNIGGKWSWKDARDYYYTALTSTNKDDREKAFAKTFRTVGQLMHLVEDASVPAHTRNDIHIPSILYPHYEQKVEAFRTKQNIYGTFWNDLLANPITFDKSILNITSTHLSAPVPISRIIDTDLYTGGNPGVTTTSFGSPQNIGIAEYTNANFMSKDTLFTHLEFNYPNISDTVLWIDNNNREYIKKVGSGDMINHLAVSSWLYPFRVTYFPQYTEYMPVGLDEECYKDYAQKLIPRAVGYSAGLLDYFFRGDLYITLLVPSTDHVGFDFHNQNDTGSNIDTVVVFIQNNSKLNNIIEPVGTGTLTLTVSYKDSSGTTFYVPAITSISITQIPEIGSASYFAALFTLTSPISTQTAQDITYYFAFRAQLGNETDAVIGKVVKGPVLYNVVPDNGLEGDVVTLTGNNLPIINGPFPTILDDNASDVRFNHDLTPYTTEVINRTTDITVKVPNTASLKKPGYGGLRVRNVLDTGEKIYSNPVSFFPIAEGEVRNTGQTIVNVTIEAVKPIVGDYSPLPQTITINNLSPGASVPIQLITGFTYKATANTTVTKDIYLLTSNVIDFVFEVQ